MSSRRHIIDSSWWRGRTPAGEIVVAGSPLRLFRFTPAARATLDALESAGITRPDSSQVVDRLVAAGAVHPVVGDTVACHRPGEVTVVIPAHDEPHQRLESLVAALGEAHSVIVVDDGSSTPVESLSGATVIRREKPSGPAAARNSAIPSVETAFILFLDADTVFDPSSWNTLLAHFDDDRVSVVAPRVRSRRGAGLLARYERSESPLDLGAEPARIAMNTRVSYAPTAALLVRTDVFTRYGRFDESLRFGEDVDFVWRLCAAGEVCRYEPSAIVEHEPRSTIIAALRQRVSYGSAATPLDARHPGGAVPLRLNRWTAAAWSLVLAGHMLIGAVVAGTSTAMLAKKLGGDRTAIRIAARLAGRGNLFAGRLVASALWRTWWPFTVVAAVLSRRARQVAVVALIVPNLWRWWERRQAGDTDLDPVTYVVARAADDVAYGTGVWKGVIVARNARALRPHID